MGKSMSREVKSLRIHFYGVQGSGSVFPRKDQRAKIRRVSEVAVVEKVLALVQNEIDSGTPSSDLVEAVVGGPVSQASLFDAWSKLTVPEPPIYGGWTSCIRIETSDGNDIVFDCGSGFRLCAQDLERTWTEQESRNLTIFGSHPHFDHTEGFYQADVCFNSKNNIHLYANASYLKALDRSSGIFSHRIADTNERQSPPLNYKQMQAKFQATELRDLSLDLKEDIHSSGSITQHVHDWNKPVIIGNTRIQAFEVFHSGSCLAFRVEHNGKVFVYCTDHELRHDLNSEHPLQIASNEAEERLILHSKDADVLYRDGQFLRAEYDGNKGIGKLTGVPRRDWGHSCIEDVIAMAKRCRVKSLYLGHHDPNRPWQELVEIDKMVQAESGSDLYMELAKAETIIDL
ncbi:MAG: phosphoribosyl 1,2-cyclic phosphodiesterase [Arenicella sp.]|jgi:phosphoribosyl 1,2-cyclic phosphodiesterase